MRVVRFPARPTRVSDDIRAALASLGKGGNLVGGVALLGATPPDSGLVIDAVLVLPRGVFVVVGVDLPDPAMTLTAPLHGEWKADGWPLVRPDDEGGEHQGRRSGRRHPRQSRRDRTGERETMRRPDSTTSTRVSAWA